ncbi:MAG: tRNA (guanosine(37)-N1)-methyltransferase TrmD [Candidatus Blackburnbacteria bacterium]|nr:tRNA (guanosine(37)-N1)-methyltransferase TrmD [Candidatus Blackburnbacteria bacterium]
MFEGPFRESIIRRAQDRSLVEINIHNLRDWAKGRHKTVDDKPYGGGVGMVLMVEPLYKALTELKRKTKKAKRKTILLDPGGKVFNQEKARGFAQLDHLILIAGHYETVDHRVREHLIDEEISIGDYVLTGGELPAMVIVDAVVRLIPGVLAKVEATQFESFSGLTENLFSQKTVPSKASGLLEYPQYTRPEDFKGWKVPETLLSGNHKKIEGWKKSASIERTRQNRPDLLK